MRLFLEQAGIFVLFGGVVGLLSHFIGEALPRGGINCEAFPFASFAWEGAFYRKIGVGRLKRFLPDASHMAIFRHMVRKNVQGDASPAHLLRLARETCVAEAVHWALLAVSPALLFFLKPPYSVLFTVPYALSNFPFIFIQRYNRPRLVRAWRRALAKEQRQNNTTGLPGEG